MANNLINFHRRALCSVLRRSSNVERGEEMERIILFAQRMRHEEISCKEKI